jgi:hypothetical protein
MKRLLGVNDGYGCQELRLAMLDELNALKPACSVEDITKSFSKLVGVQDRKKNIVMYVALRLEEMAIVSALWKCNGHKS